MPCSTPLAPTAAAVISSPLGLAACRLLRMASMNRVSPPAAWRWLTPLPWPSPRGCQFPLCQRLSLQRQWVWPASKPTKISPSLIGRYSRVGLGGLVGLTQGCQAKPTDDLHFWSEENGVCGTLDDQPGDGGQAPQPGQCQISR